MTFFWLNKTMRRFHPQDLSYLSLDQWSNMPFSALKFDIKKSWLAPLVAQVQQELKARGINPFFHTWVADEWFSPDGCPGIAIPYYLFHPNLIRLQKMHGLEVEGATNKAALKLIRHEVGHAIENAWRLRRKKIRQQLFGHSSSPYPNFYRPVQNTTDYVEHLGDGYAQSHPDEDWAETFALWLSQSPRTWKTKYRGTKALIKLEYCHKVMQEIAGTKPLNTELFVVSPIKDQKGTIGELMQAQSKNRLKSLLKIQKDTKISHEISSAAILKQMQNLYKQNGLGILM